MNVAQLADQLRRDHQFMQDVTRWEVIPARPAQTAPFVFTYDSQENHFVRLAMAYG